MKKKAAPAKRVRTVNLHPEKDTKAYYSLRVLKCSDKTLSRWIKTVVPQLEELGYRKSQQRFTPAMCKIINKHVGITEEEYNNPK